MHSNETAPRGCSALEILEQEFYAGRPERQEDLEIARLNARIARTIYQLRMAAGLTQQQLAKRVGTSTSTICRLENDDYDGHSLTMLKRIASALGYCLDVQFIGKEDGDPPAKS